jgi:hypothetical protein
MDSSQGRIPMGPLFRHGLAVAHSTLQRVVCSVFVLVCGTGMAFAHGTHSGPEMTTEKPTSKSGLPRAYSLACQMRTSTDPWVLLDQASASRPMKFNEKESIAEFDARLRAHDRGMSSEIAQGDQATRAVRLVARLYANMYVVAAQMAQGAAANQSLWPERLTRSVGDMVYVAHEPIQEGDDFSKIASLVKAADEVIVGMGKPRAAYARWVIRGYAYDDAIAIAAATAGYCASGPSADENRLLEQAVKIARLDPAKLVEPTQSAPRQTQTSKKKHAPGN